MSSDSMEVGGADLAQAWPVIDPGVQPLGARVLVQVRHTPPTTKSGLILATDTKDTVKWNQQTGKVIALGPLAFRNRETMAPWAEGIWVSVGDYVRTPRWSGDRIEIPYKKDEDPIVFVIMNDHELIAKVTGDPLMQRAFII